jgi:hypothetical protein
MVVWLEIEIGVIGKGGTKRGTEGGSQGRDMVTAVVCGPCVCVWMYCHCCSGGCLACRGLGVCTVDTVGW